MYWRLQQDQRCRTLATVGLILVRHNRWRAEYCRGAHPPTVFGYHVTWSTGTMFLFGIVVGAVALLEPIVLVAGTPSLARRRHDARTAPAPSNGQSWSSTAASTPDQVPTLGGQHGRTGVLTRARQRRRGSPRRRRGRLIHSRLTRRTTNTVAESA